MSNKKFDSLKAIKEKLKNQQIGISVSTNTMIENENNSLVKIDKDNFDMFDLKALNDWGIENAEDLKFCTEKIVKIGNDVSNTTLELGKDFEEIFQRFSQQGSENGIYEKLIEYLGFNIKTVRRWRKRYSLFQLAKTQNEKELIATIPTNCIEKLSKLSTSEINNILNENTTREELLKFVNIEKLENKEKKLDESKKVSDTMSESYNFSEDKILDIFDNFSQKIEKLSMDKKEKVNKLIETIEKILNS